MTSENINKAFEEYSFKEVKRNFRDIKREFKNKGFKLKPYKKGILFNKQIGFKKHNCEQLFYKNYEELLKFYKSDLK